MQQSKSTNQKNWIFVEYDISNEHFKESRRTMIPKNSNFSFEQVQFKVCLSTNNNNINKVHKRKQLSLKKVKSSKTMSQQPWVNTTVTNDKTSMQQITDLPPQPIPNSVSPIQRNKLPVEANALCKEPACDTNFEYTLEDIDSLLSQL